LPHPVEEITIAGNLRDMFRNMAGVGNDVLVRGSKQVGSLLIEQMKVAAPSLWGRAANFSGADKSAHCSALGIWPAAFAIIGEAFHLQETKRGDKLWKDVRF
jgi:hypothetical protein